MLCKISYSLIFSLVLVFYNTTVNAFSVDKGQLYNAQNQPIVLQGVNWFGFETQDHVVHGLWARNWQDMIGQIKTAGFNAVRLPFCPGTLQGVTPGAIDAQQNPDLQGLDSLQLLDKVIAELDKQGLYILLDHHRPDCKAISNLWYTDSYSEAQWLEDLSFVAQRYAGISHVIGIDLKNEPHGEATWGTGNVATDWNTAAEKAAAAVLAVNPHLLIFVEGVENNPQCSGAINHWWGGNLEPQACHPLAIPADKLVFSPHVYGPDVYAQDYFQAADFPENLPAIWDAHFGYLAAQGQAVVPGEFGGHYAPGSADQQWQDAFVSYLLNKNMRSFFYWSWNPNSGDTGGILNDDWQTLREDKLTLLRRLMTTDNSNTSEPVTEPVTDPAPETDPQTPPVTTPDFDSLIQNGTCAARYQIRSQWQQGMVVQVEIYNTGTQALSPWQLNWQFPADLRIDNYWNIALQNQNSLSAIPLAWNNMIPAGGKIEFGLQLGFAQAPTHLFLQPDLSCGQQQSTPEIPPLTDSRYTQGHADGIAYCQQNPAACGLSQCQDDSARYHPDSGALYLPQVQLTGHAEQGWEVHMQQHNGLFELRAILPIE